MRRLAVLLAAAVLVPVGAASAGATGGGSSGSGLTHHQYAAADGLRAYSVYEPDTRGNAKRPLVVVLHGCTQTAKAAVDGTRWTELADREGVVVAFPEQLRAVNGAGCWNWFDPLQQRREGVEPTALAGITRRVTEAFRVDPRRVYVIGISAGADMATVLGATYPDVYAAIGTVAGCAFATCADETGALALAAMGDRARQVPVFALQGTADPLNNAAMGATAVAQWLGTNDLADDGTVGSVPRTPTRTRTTRPSTDLRPDPSASAACVRNGQWPCPAGVLGWQEYPYTVDEYDAAGRLLVESWTVHGLSHNWSGGDPRGSFTDPAGPATTEAAWRFFERFRLPR